MPAKNFIKQKKLGLALIILASLMLGLVLIVRLWWNGEEAGFASLLPGKDVAAYVEFSTQIDDDLALKINSALKLDWKNEIIPWTDKGALAFLGSEKNKDQLIPFAIFHLASLEKAMTFLKTFRNPKNELKETQSGNTKIFATPALVFASTDNTIIISSSVENINLLLSEKLVLAQKLSDSSDFAKIKRNLLVSDADLESNQFFVYAKPQSLPKNAYSLLTTEIPSTPLITASLPTLGILAEKDGKIWQGKSYAATNDTPWGTSDQGYRATLLSFLPPDFELFISGQNLATQLKKTDALIKSAQMMPNMEVFTGLFTKEYLPDIDFDRDVAPLFSKEFALTVNGNSVLAIAEMPNVLLESSTTKIRAAFKKISGKFTPTARTVTLPDGTKAQELIPDDSKVKVYGENLQGIAIKGFYFGAGGKLTGIFDALAQGKWFVSNDISALRTALLLTKNPGPNFRESDRYRQSLQPILKNPEFLGIASLPAGTFSFSKRTFSSHMETNFRFVLN